VRHDRPAGRDGRPVKLWALTCASGCEDHLRSQPGWSATISKIPETYDEKADREDFAERGQLDERRLMAMALAKLTGISLPETLTGMAPGGLLQGELECAEGHPCRAGSKFCPECGSPVRVDSSPAVALCPEGHENAAASRFCAECGLAVGAAALPPAGVPGATAPADDLSGLSANDLRKLAKERGLDAGGTKADVLSRLQAA
jgi:hypothetical protein